MKNIFIGTFFVIIFILFNIEAIADSKKDCSQYSTKTYTGLLDKIRCKKGLPPLKNNWLKSLEYKSLKANKSEKVYQDNKPCDEYSTKTIVGLWSKIKCKKNK